MSELKEVLQTIELSVAGSLNLKEIEAARKLLANRKLRSKLKEFLGKKHNHPDQIELQEELAETIDNLQIEFRKKIDALEAWNDACKIVLMGGGAGVIGAGFIAAFTIAIPPLALFPVAAGAYSSYRGYRENMDTRQKITILSDMLEKLESLN